MHQRVPEGELYIGKIKIISLFALKWVGIAKNAEHFTFESIFEITIIDRSVPDASKYFQIFEFSSVFFIF